MSFRANVPRARRARCIRTKGARLSKYARRTLCDVVGSDRQRKVGLRFGVVVKLRVRFVLAQMGRGRQHDQPLK